LNILITGAGGFLGQYLANNLAEHNVTALTRKQLNLCDSSAVCTHFEQHTYDTVIHCAAAGRNTPVAEDWNIVSNNLSATINLMTVRHRFNQLINIGTGAEFDISTVIENTSESEIFNRQPVQSYGFSKNMVARYLSEQPGCFTLRLFGCFDGSEDERRLLKKCRSVVSQGQTFTIQDRWFDMISAQDFAVIVRAVIDNTVSHTDINCVYSNKHRISDILKMFCEQQGLDSSLILVDGQGLSYTGNSDRLDCYQLPLLGLQQSLSVY
jgi:nucleoside-diphosphate-sugar epimerase